MDHGRHGEHGSLLCADETFRIRGAIFEVYRVVGVGFLEAVYQESLAIELSDRGIPFAAGRPIKLAYKGRPLRQTYTPDFVCFDRVILELKAAREIAPEHRAQVVNYLRATGLRVGLLVNFSAVPEVKIERFAL